MTYSFTDEQQIEEFSMEMFYAMRDELFALIDACEELEESN